MLKKTLGVMAVSGLLTASLVAQQPRPAEKPTPRSEAAERQAMQPSIGTEATPFPAPGGVGGGQAVNVRLELTITDQTGPGEPTRKVITMIVADRQNGFIRSKATVRAPVVSTPPGVVGMGMAQYRDLTINVDARPVLLKPAAEGGNIRVDLGLEYQPTIPSGSGAAPADEPGMSNLNERISVIIEPGKPLTISQAADPASDRRISVELKATILK